MVIRHRQLDEQQPKTQCPETNCSNNHFPSRLATVEYVVNQFVEASVIRNCFSDTSKSRIDRGRETIAINHVVCINFFIQ